MKPEKIWNVELKNPQNIELTLYSSDIFFICKIDCIKVKVSPYLEFFFSFFCKDGYKMLSAYKILFFAFGSALWGNPK